MPILTQGASVDLTINADSTLTLQSPNGGLVTVENPVGTVVWRGGEANRRIDLRSGIARVTANTRDVFYELASDPAQEFPVTFDPLTGQMRANGSTVSGDGKTIPAQPSVAGAARQALRRSSNPGTIVSDFVGTKWIAASGTPTIAADVTGYDANGNRTGVVSRTGQASMMRVTPTANGDAIRLPFGALNIALNGRFGLWVHLAKITGADTGAGPTLGTITMVLSTSPAGIGSGAAISWTILGQLREGWNFLKFVQKGSVFNSPSNTQVGANVFNGNHPYGVGAGIYGTGADSEIAAANVRSAQLVFNNCVGWDITLDSIWTGFTSRAVVVPGCDQAAQSCLNIAVPLFQQYGWRGYVCSPRGVLPNPTTATYADMAAEPAYSDVRGARETYPVLGSIYDAGWDVINHTWTHRSMGYLTNPAEIQMEIERARAWAVSSGMPRGSEFYASPYSSTSRLAEAVIAGCGMVWQRHAKKINNSLTPWGLDNPSSLGSYDLGNQSTAQSVSLMKNVLDNCERYGDVFFPFWHDIRTLGDPGDGSGIYTPDNQNIYASNFRQFFGYVRERELAGGLDVRSPTQLYYGE